MVAVNLLKQVPTIVEIYNEKITDLLNPGAGEIKIRGAHGVGRGVFEDVSNANVLFSFHSIFNTQTQISGKLTILIIFLL